MHKMHCLLCLSLLFATCKKEEGHTNRPPAITSLTGNLAGASAYDYRFAALATDQDFDNLTYSWDFGDGITKANGAKNEAHTYAANAPATVTVKLEVSDGKAVSTASLTLTLSTGNPVTLVCNPAVRFQTMEGFGGFGAQTVYWEPGPYTSASFINDIVTDLGCSIIRDELCTSFEIQNDNADPMVTDLSKFNLNTPVPGHHAPLGQRLPHFKALHQAGVDKFIITVWSAPPWMKWNNQIDNGTSENSAPPYDDTPDANTNQLKTEYYAEFAEMCAAYCRIFKQEVGVDVYALSVQNEPRFSQFYQSCIHNGTSLRDLSKAVGQRLAAEGLPTRLFLPEDIGWFDAMSALTQPSLQDADTRQYIKAIAVHGYAFDGIQAGSADAQTWEAMHGWGVPYNIPTWMTETSGFANTFDGAMDLAKALYVALEYGKVSVWTFWSLSEPTLSAYSLRDRNGNKSKRFYTSKQFYRYIRPGAVRFEVKDNPSLPDTKFLAFEKDGKRSLVILNFGTQSSNVRLPADIFTAPQYNLYRTTATEDCARIGTLSGNSTSFIIPPRCVMTVTED
ncbi:MAG: PKD domain-containing protein [Saprospiraceae bacterium]|nr:PKD domain-containing protein [Saprospiraceae bacterium]